MDRAPRAPSERWVAVTTRTAAPQLDGTQHAGLPECREDLQLCFYTQAAAGQLQRGLKLSGESRVNRRADVVMFLCENMNHPRTQSHMFPRHARRDRGRQ